MTDTNMPANAAERFPQEQGWYPYSVPEEWVELIRDWTTAFSLSYPDFKYHQIKVKFDEARVYAEGIPADRLRRMEDDLTAALHD